MGLTDNYRVFHTNCKEYTLYLAAHGSFSKIDHMPVHKTNLYKYRKIKIIPYILSDYYTIQLKIANKTLTSI